MKKIGLSLIVIITLCYSHFIFANSIETIYSEPNWTGFYLGGNAGYWRSQSNDVDTAGTTHFINPTFPLGGSNITNALVKMATNDFSFHSYGFIGGAQAGYNYQYNKEVLFGIDIDFDGLTNSNHTYNLHKAVNLLDFDEYYAGSLNVEQKIHYLGTIRARLGYLYCPTILLYATGGFAYGNVTLDTAWRIQESLGSLVFPIIAAQNNLQKTLPGWSAGAGIEWLFKPNWSAKFEYTYYSLNKLNAPVTLEQINGSLSPPILWGSVTANTALSVSLGTIRMGINYHF